MSETITVDVVSAPTLQFRWLERPRAPGRGASLTLQQKFTISSSRLGQRFNSRTEWRDVPTETEA